MLKYLPKRSTITAVCCLTVKNEDNKIKNPKNNKTINAMSIMLKFKFKMSVKLQNLNLVFDKIMIISQNDNIHLKIAKKYIDKKNLLKRRFFNL